MKISVFVEVDDYGSSLYRTISCLYNGIKKGRQNVNIEIFLFSSKKISLDISYLKKKFGDNIYCKQIGRDKSFNKLLLEANSEKLLFVTQGSFVCSSFIEYILNNDLNKNIVIPEYYINKRAKTNITRFFSSDDKLFNISDLVWNNCFGEIFACNKTIVKDIKEISWKDYLWRFYCESISNNCVVKCVHKTIVFSENSFVPKSEPLVGDSSLHNPTVLEKFFTNNNDEIKSKGSRFNFVLFLKGVVIKIFKLLARVNIIKSSLNIAIVNKIYKRFIQVTNPLLEEEWFLNAFSEINLYTPEFFALSEFPNITECYKSVCDKYAKDFFSIVNDIGGNVDHLIFCPWFKIGGAEKVVLNLIKGFLSINPKAKIVLVTLRESEVMLQSRLPKQVIFIDIGNKYPYQDYYVRERLLATVIAFIKPKFIYNIGCYEISEMYIRYGAYLSKVSKYNPFFFSSRRMNYNIYYSFGITYVDKIFKYSDLIFSDNYNELKFLSDYYGLHKEDKLRVLYQPVEVMRKPDADKIKNGDFNILWASRLDEEKHPEILIEIANKCRDLPVCFYVYGQPVLSKFDIQDFNQYPNIKYMGGFSKGLNNLETKDYNLFLYTSEYDGMPNVILEAVSIGLPVLSSNVGGIQELIKDFETGFLVEDYTNIDMYVEKIKYLLANRDKMYECSVNAQKVLEKEHSFDSMNKRLKEYLNL
ncbi:MAG: glycosyltransferase [Candidatus Dojkabacteria bacterium]|jgi:glycosyltransferase involved in cell wall biosynthesis